jgi:hypothetical protein
MRIKEIRVEGWKFSGFEGLLYYQCKWWYNGVLVKEVYNNGSMALLINGVKYGKDKFLKARRKDAVKVVLVVDDLPF